MSIKKRNSDTIAITQDIKILSTSMLQAVNQTIQELEQFDGDLIKNSRVSPHTINSPEGIDDFFISAQDEEHNIVNLYFEYDDNSIRYTRLQKSS